METRFSQLLNNHYIQQVTKPPRMRNHLFNIRKASSSSKWEHVQQSTWTNRINSSRSQHLFTNWRRYSNYWFQYPPSYSLSSLEDFSSSLCYKKMMMLFIQVYVHPTPLYTWGGLIYWSKGFHFGSYNWVLIKKISNISIEALPLHNFIGPAATNLIQEHFIWHTSQNYKQQMKLYLSTKIYIGVLLYPIAAAPMHHQVMAVPHIF